MGTRMPLPVTGLTSEERDLLEASADWTMCSGLQKQLMMDATRYILAAEIPGAIVECGVWRGGMMQIAARTILSTSPNATRELWLFDTFAGMPTPTHALDRDLYRGEHASIKMNREEREGKDGEPTIWCLADLGDVTLGMTETGYPEDHIHYIQGLVEHTIPKNAPAAIAILRVDTDWYASTYHILENLFDRVSPGGIVVLDDYDSWEGARTAADEFFASKELHPLLIRLDKGRVYMKAGI